VPQWRAYGTTVVAVFPSTYELISSGFPLSVSRNRIRELCSTRVSGRREEESRKLSVRAGAVTSYVQLVRTPSALTTFRSKGTRDSSLLHLPCGAPQTRTHSSPKSPPANANGMRPPQAWTGAAIPRTPVACLSISPRHFDLWNHLAESALFTCETHHALPNPRLPRLPRAKYSPCSQLNDGR
jgi:hypothetical protein